MTKLRSSMDQFLKDWRDDIDSAWSGVLAAASPNLDAIDPALTLEDLETIFPGRRGHPAPGARADSHIFRALDGLRPDDVCAVVLGQDPYPRSARATGRSFEQGDLPRWNRKSSEVAESLRRIIQVVAHFRTGRNTYLQGDSAWGPLVDDIDAKRINLAQPREFFDDWQAQGILCLNAGLTLSRFAPAVQQAHFHLWRPIVQAIFRRLVTRQDRSVVFLLWGGVAFETFSNLGILEIATTAGTGDRVAVVRHPHPGAEGGGGAPLFLQTPNTFAVANERLESAGGQALHW